MTSKSHDPRRDVASLADARRKQGAGTPDDDLRDACAAWVRLLVVESPGDDITARLVELANRLATTPATTRAGIRYKLTAAIGHTLARDGEDNVMVELLTSAIEDLDALDGSAEGPEGQLAR